jgi:methyltransferase (TIGR00027 family)
LRLFIAMRSRFAEDSARLAIEKGVRQILVLGAGLDTFAYRLEPTPDLRIFELDHPATQAEKRRRLTEAQIAEPAHVSYIAHDFERGSMTAALQAAGFGPDKPTFVLWLGVTPYLTEEALFATLGELARLRGGAEVVFDYANPPHAIEEEATRDLHRQMAERVAASGEPFRCYLDSPELHARARELGFLDIEDLDRAALVARYLPDLPIAPRPGGDRTCRADGDAINRRRLSAGRRRRDALLPQPVIFGLVDRLRGRIAKIVQMHPVGLARAPRRER